jgi:hypothetical protein
MASPLCFDFIEQVVQNREQLVDVDDIPPVDSSETVMKLTATARMS